MIKNTLRAVWPLFFGIALLQVGNGLQGILLGWRASLESFSTLVTGLVMTGFYLGFLIGSSYTQVIIGNVGHIRVFAAFASLASTAILVQAVYVNPGVWFIARIVTGLCYAGLYIVVESWLNDRATNKTRGNLFSIYMLLSYLSMAVGQWTMKFSDPGGYDLFVLVSILVSIALIPLLLTKTTAPSFSENESISITELIKISPLGMFGIFGTGLVHSAVFGMGAVYAARAGMSVSQTALFTSIFILGGVLLQWPVGLISDHFDRRKVITIVTFLAGLMGLFLYKSPATENMSFLLFALYGGLSLPLYSLVIAHANDRLKPEQMIGASSGLIMFYGIGSSAGPLTIAIMLEQYDSSGFFIYLTLIHLSIGVVALIMMGKRDAVSAEEQATFVPVSPRSTVVAVEAVAQIVDEENKHNNAE
jgi:MFS family permease